MIFCLLFHKPCFPTEDTNSVQTPVTAQGGCRLPRSQLGTFRLPTLQGQLAVSGDISEWSKPVAEAGEGL